MLKKAAILAALLIPAGYLAKKAVFPEKRELLVRGEIRLSPEISRPKIRPNSTLYIVMKNSADIPVAVQSIINPVFPQKFSLTAKDIIMPDLLSGKMALEAILSKSGNMDRISAGDLVGKSAEKVGNRSSGVLIILGKSR